MLPKIAGSRSKGWDFPEITGNYQDWWDLLGFTGSRSIYGIERFFMGSFDILRGFLWDLTGLFGIFTESYGSFWDFYDSSGFRIDRYSHKISFLGMYGNVQDQVFSPIPTKIPKIP